MRVLLVNKHAHVTGGADQHVLLLRAALEKHGVTVALLSSEGGDADYQIPCTVTHSTRESLQPTTKASVALQALWNRRAAQLTRQALSDFQPDVVHAHKLYPQLSVAPITVARTAGVPIVQTVHDYEFISANPLDHTGGRRDRMESRSSYRLLNDLMFLVRRQLHMPSVMSWIAVSEAVATMHSARGITCSVVPNFVPHSATGSPTTRDGILFVGRLTEEKGVRHVIALARRLPRLAVSIAGWGPLTPVVESACRELPNLRFAGRVAPDALPDIFARALVTVIPSLWEEPGALSVLESMAVGTPLVVYRRGGAAEYVENARAGLVVEPDPARLEAGVRALLDDSALWERCSSSARESVATTHSAASHVRRLTAIYDRASS